MQGTSYRDMPHQRFYGVEFITTDAELFPKEKQLKIDFWGGIKL